MRTPRTTAVLCFALAVLASHVAWGQLSVAETSVTSPTRYLSPAWEVQTVAIAQDRQADGQFAAPCLLVMLRTPEWANPASQNRYLRTTDSTSRKSEAARSATADTRPAAEPKPATAAEKPAAPRSGDSQGGGRLGGGGYGGGATAYYGASYAGSLGTVEATDTYVTATVQEKPWRGLLRAARQTWAGTGGQSLELRFDLPPAGKVSTFDLALTMDTKLYGTAGRFQVAIAGAGTKSDQAATLPISSDPYAVALSQASAEGGRAWSPSPTLRITKVELASVPSAEEIDRLREAFTLRYRQTAQTQRTSGLETAPNEARQGLEMELEGNEAAAISRLSVEGAALAVEAMATQAVWTAAGARLQEGQQGPPMLIRLWFPLKSVPGQWTLQLDLKAEGGTTEPLKWTFKNLPVPGR